jgi:tRNA-splicing ligase RtcB (3'-phosphate/5'-hydroxy nucleic acid ligase)
VTSDLPVGQTRRSLHCSPNRARYFLNRSASIEEAVPHGRTDNGGPNDKGAWSKIPQAQAEAWSQLKAAYDAIVAKHRKIDRGPHVTHLGTLGTGNHFIEICLDEQQHVWFMLHSGSRGVGDRIGS